MFISSQCEGIWKKRSNVLHINKRGVGSELPTSPLGFLNPGETVPGTLLTAGYSDSRGDPDDTAGKRKISGCVRSRIVRHGLSKISELCIVPFLVVLAFRRNYSPISRVEVRSRRFSKQLSVTYQTLRDHNLGTAV